jgi:hypothetical protein
MKNFLFTLLISLILLGSQSCGKDNDAFIPTGTTTIVKSDTSWQEDLAKISDLPISLLAKLNVEKLMENLATEPIERELSAERGGIITTPDSVTVEFPANSCTSKNNQPCTGTLKVEIVVLRKKGEFLLNNVPTVSLGKQLISGGAVYVRVLQNGEEVKLARGMSYKVRFLPTGTTDAAMKLFEGKQVGRFNFIWTPALPLNVTGTSADFPLLRVWADSVQGRRTSGYELGLDRFTWINCDKFSGDSTNLTNKFCVALPDTFTNQNTSVFAVFKDINSVVSLIGDGKTKQFCVPSSYRGLPIGKLITVITISNIKDRVYIGKKEVTIAANATITIQPTVTTKESAKELISNL